MLRIRLRHLLALTVAAAVLTLAACGGGSDTGADVATVGDTSISRADFERTIAQTQAQAANQKRQAESAGQGDQVQDFPKPGTSAYTQMQLSILQQLVDREVTHQAVIACGTPCRVSEATVTKQIKKIKDSNFAGSDSSFKDFLASSKLNMDDVRRIVRAEVESQQLLKWASRDVRYTAADAQSYYDKNTAQFKVPAQREVFHILVKDKAKAQQIAAAARAGEDFATLAKENSIDTGSKDKGGDVGVLQDGQFVKEFEAAAKKLGDGEISDPVRSTYGWHVIRIEDRPAHLASFAEVKTNLILQNRQAAKSAAYQKVIDATKKKLKVTYPDPTLDPTKPATSASPTTK